MNISTTVHKFPVQDITHHPTRFQGDNIPKEEVKEEFVQSPVPQYPTIESAIEFYESNAVGEMKNLYNATSMWLRTILSRKRTHNEEVPEHADSEDNEE